MVRQPKKPEPVLRFAAGSPTALQSSVWRLWVHGDDVYLASRVLAKWIKVSLHASGIWRTAWTQQMQRPRTGDRVVQRWQRPTEFRPGWVQGPSVAVPWTPTPDPLNSPVGLDLADVVWLPGPAPFSTVAFTVQITAPAVSAETWQAIGNSGGDRLVGTLPMKSRETVGVIWRQMPQTDQDRSYVAQLVSQLGVVKVNDPSAKAFLNLIHVGNEPNGRPILVEVIMGREHLGPHASASR
jgi:hypothetical protein